MKIKQPSETITLAFKLAGDTLVAPVTVITDSRGLVPGSAALVVVASRIVAGSTIEVDVGGGTDGERYLVTVRAALASSSLMREREAELAVVDLAWELPLGGAYLTPTQFVERAGLDLSARLTDEAGMGRINGTRLADAITDAAAEADGYLAGRYATPLSSVPALLAAIVYDLALARLWAGMPQVPDPVAAREKAARVQLRDIADGRLTLPGAAALTPAEGSPAPVLVAGGDRQLSRDRLRGF